MYHAASLPGNPAGYIAYISTQDSTTEYDYFPVNK